MIIKKHHFKGYFLKTVSQKLDDVDNTVYLSTYEK